LRPLSLRCSRKTPGVPVLSALIGILSDPDGDDGFHTLDDRMLESSTHTALEQLKLGSRLADLALVPGWVESLAAEHGLPSELGFAVNLCLEEALSNVIRHGYRGEPDHAIAIHCSIRRPAAGAGELAFAIEDQAPHFNPLEAEQAAEAPIPLTLDDVTPGGQGIRLLRKFAGSLAYEPLPDGNRLILGFSFPRA
jgi:anti-sigma regulatory factor (Ser/Thr protein kinase)